MAQGSSGRGKNRGIEENSDKKVVVSAVHDPGVELTELDARVKSFDRLSGPETVIPVRKKDWPERRRFPNGEDDYT